MDLRIDLETISEDNQIEAPSTFDLSNPRHLHAIVVAFGVGMFVEARAIGHSRAAVYAFVRLIQRGGYGQIAEGPTQERRLYRDGDACFPAPDPFVFVSASTLNGEQIDIARLEEDMHTFFCDGTGDGTGHGPDGDPEPRAESPAS